MRKLLLHHKAAMDYHNATLSRAWLATAEEALGLVYLEFGLTGTLPLPTTSLVACQANCEDWRGNFISWGDNPSAGVFPKESGTTLLVDGVEVPVDRDPE